MLLLFGAVYNFSVNAVTNALSVTVELVKLAVRLTTVSIQVPA